MILVVPMCSVAVKFYWADLLFCSKATRVLLHSWRSGLRSIMKSLQRLKTPASHPWLMSLIVLVTLSSTLMRSDIISRSL